MVKKGWLLKKTEKYCEGSIHYFLTQFVFFTRTGQYMLIKHEVYENLEVSDKTNSEIPFIESLAISYTRLWANALDIDIARMGSEAS